VDNTSDGNSWFKFKVGDMVQEKYMIIPPDRTCWTGIVVYITRDHYRFVYDVDDKTLEDMVGICWMQTGEVEELPGTVIKLLHRPEKNKK